MRVRCLLFVFFLFPGAVPAQMEGRYGDFSEYKNGLHSGNQFRTTFYNDGHYGRSDTGIDDIGGEWPINSGHSYMWDGNPFVGSEIIDANNDLKHIVSGPISLGGSITVGQQGPDGDWWTFLPLPGFTNSDTNKVAMSKWRWSWPAFWPDKTDDALAPGWPGAWNGYFGRDVYNADEESYWVMDDARNQEFAFYPDENDLLRRGLGMRVTCRGLQWSTALVEDAIFTLYDIENIATAVHDKMVFGFKIGAVVGALVTDAGDGWDDSGAYDVDEDIAYLFDHDLIGTNGWYPIGYFGATFLESPGNPYDGIDNDGDGSLGPGPVVTEAMFAPMVLNAGDPIVLIDYKTFERTVTELPADTFRVTYQDQVFTYYPGVTVTETANNLVDDNLNGLIDESNGSTIGEPPDEITRYLYVGQKCVDYFNGEGLDNILLDERRDDGVDNDRDWNALFDDVGLDGVEGSGDSGEGDGVPSSGRGTDLPGEPHIDKTDVDEGDMLGLTSFTLFLWEEIPLYEDELLWKAMYPGYLDDLLQNNNTELLYGSGYFPMKSGDRERFSMGLLCGDDLNDLLENKRWVARAYSENYNFSKAPLIPTLWAVPGDNRVTLHWDDLAEKSVDPVSGLDFEGYRIYRSTDPGFKDMTPITDGYGSVIYRRPLAQFDLKNDFEGFAEARIKGQSFYLGDNTGIVHSFVDTTARNGYTYYYAVSSYDRGEPPLVPPSECAKYISISTSGEIDKGRNVVIARPEAPASGYVHPDSSGGGWTGRSTTSGHIGFDVVDAHQIRDADYRVVFDDTVVVRNGRRYPDSKSYSLIDITEPERPDTLIRENRCFGPDDEQPMVHGYRLSLHNLPELALLESESGWTRRGLYNYRFTPYKKARVEGVARSGDYRIEFGEVGLDTSADYETFKAMPVNFKVLNLSENREIDFAFYELDGSDGVFSAYTVKSRADIIIFLEPDMDDSLAVTWGFELSRSGSDSTAEGPRSGDAIVLRLAKPFLSHDVYEFSTRAERVDPVKTKNEMERIRVVPNPYVVANSWEPLNPYSTGRGPRELHFTHLPPRCTIKIFNIRGQLVGELEHDDPAWNGTEIWDMQTKDRLDISYGVYIYHVDAGEAGQITGKFAVIK